MTFEVIHSNWDNNNLRITRHWKQKSATFKLYSRVKNKTFDKGRDKFNLKKGSEIDMDTVRKFSDSKIKVKLRKI